MHFTNEANPQYKLSVENVSLWLPYVKFKRFENLVLSSHQLDLTWRQPRVVKSNNLGSSSGSYNIPATSDKVLSLYVLPPYDERNVSFDHNLMIFDRLGMIKCWLLVYNARMPNVSCIMDSPNKDYWRVFAALLEAGLNNINAETGCLMDYA